jgi:hypothetical protein
MRNALSAASSGVDGQEEEDIAALPNTRYANESWRVDRYSRSPTQHATVAA